MGKGMWSGEREVERRHGKISLISDFYLFCFKNLHLCMIEGVRRLKVNLHESVVSSPQVGPGARTQVSRVGRQAPLSPSLLTGLLFSFSKIQNPGHPGTPLYLTSCFLEAGAAVFNSYKCTHFNL